MANVGARICGRDNNNFHLLQKKNLANLNLSIKERYLEDVIINTSKFALDCKFNLTEHWINNCIRAKSNVGEDRRESIYQLSRNDSKYFGTKVFPRGFQKALAIGFIFEYGRSAFGVNGTFDFEYFKEIISSSCIINCNNKKIILANLEPKYFKHIALIKNKAGNFTKEVKFGENEYKNTFCIEGLGDLKLTNDKRSVLKNVFNDLFSKQAMDSIYFKYDFSVDNMSSGEVDFTHELINKLSKAKTESAKKTIIREFKVWLQSIYRPNESLTRQAVEYNENAIASVDVYAINHYGDKSPLITKHGDAYRYIGYEHTGNYICKFIHVHPLVSVALKSYAFVSLNTSTKLQYDDESVVKLKEYLVNCGFLYNNFKGLIKGNLSHELRDIASVHNDSLVISEKNCCQNHLMAKINL